MHLGQGCPVHVPINSLHSAKVVDLELVINPQLSGFEISKCLLNNNLNIRWEFGASIFGPSLEAFNLLEHSTQTQPFPHLTTSEKCVEQMEPCTNGCKLL